MTILFKPIWSLLCFSLVSWAAAFKEADFSSEDILNYDVCVIGGGSAGTYAAIRLRDFHKKVAVVEIKDRLGGHTETYTDPVSKATIDIGVIDFQNIALVRNYFGRFNISMEPINFEIPGVTTEYVDFQTGKIVKGYAPPNANTSGGALQAYATQLAKYPYLDQSLGDLPHPVPADLLLPFGDFIQKYSLQDAIQLFNSYGQGFGDILQLTTLYTIKYFSPGLFRDYQLGFLTTTLNNNSLLYEKAQAELGANAFLSSHVVAMDRSNPKYAKLLIQTPSGLKLIRAKKIVSTIPPILSNLAGFDLDPTELHLFKQFRYHSYYAGILRHSGIPTNLSLVNVGTNTTYNLPILPAAYGITQTRAPGLHLFQAAANAGQVLTNQQVEANIIASIDRMRAVGTLPNSNETTPGYAFFSSHTPYEVYVSTSAIAGGFYNRLFALQGKRNTFWSGAAFVTPDSTVIWQYTETLIPELLAQIRGKIKRYDIMRDVGFGP